MTDVSYEEEWWRAAEEEDGESAREIVRGGNFHPVWRYGPKSETPLTHAVNKANLEITEYVCEAAAMPPNPEASGIWKKGILDAKNMDGKTALHIAAEMDFEQSEGIIQALMSAGADLEVTDGDGNTAYDIADSNGNMETIDLLSGIEPEE